MATPMTFKSALDAPRQQLAERYLRFGQFQVDLQCEELLKEGLRVHISSKVFQVLLALVERPGQTVTREALRARLWPEGTFVNYDANVNTTVNKLRLALGDSREKPTYVKTIPRKGYCFVGNVESGNELSRTSGVLTIAPTDAVDCLAAQQEGSSIIAGKIINERSSALLMIGWGAAIFLCGALVGVGIALLMLRP